MINVGFYWDIFTNIYATRLVNFFVIIYYICCNIKIIVMIILSKYCVIKNGLKSLYFSLWWLNLWKQKWKKKIIAKLVSPKIFFQEYRQVSVAMFYITQVEVALNRQSFLLPILLTSSWDAQRYGDLRKSKYNIQWDIFFS